MVPLAHGSSCPRTFRSPARTCCLTTVTPARQSVLGAILVGRAARTVRCVSQRTGEPYVGKYPIPVKKPPQAMQ